MFLVTDAVNCPVSWSNCRPAGMPPPENGLFWIAEFEPYVRLLLNTGSNDDSAASTPREPNSTPDSRIAGS